MTQSKIDLLEDIYEILREILIRENQIGPDEFVWIVSLSKSNTILSIEEIGTDSQDTRILPQEVFRIAILKEAHNIIMVHAHISGKLEPSQKELDITDQMIQVGKIVNIELIDHLIINEEEFFSFERHGLIEKLKKSKKWAPPSLNGIED
jgi:DNA repair protein RadC